MSDKVSLVGTRIYRVLPDTPVVLTITVGDGQVAGTSLTWDGEVTQETSIVDRDIGNEREDLTGKVLTCTTTVKDVNEFTNRTSVTYVLEGGSEGRTEYPFSVSVEAHGAYAVYMITFVFLR